MQATILSARSHNLRSAAAAGLKGKGPVFTFDFSRLLGAEFLIPQPGGLAGPGPGSVGVFSFPGTKKTPGCLSPGCFCRRIRSCWNQVYFKTSSIVVSPFRIARTPSSRMVTIPSSRAFSRMAMVGALARTRSLIFGFITRSSVSAFRPL